MTKILDVLVVESHPRAAAGAVQALEASGHRVHRCHDDPERGFPCQGLSAPSACPIDGHVDVALVVRRGLNPTPTRLEDGVRCAIRAEIPIVEDGSEGLDPFRPWVAGRIRPDVDVVEGCIDAAALSLEPMRREVSSRISKLLAVGRIDAADVHCRFEAHGSSLDVHLDLPEQVSRSHQQALAVRVLDAVRASGRTFGRVDVHVHAPDPHHQG